MERFVLKNIIVILFLVYSKPDFGQGFQCFIANDKLTSPNVFEFEVFIKDTSLTPAPGDAFLIRTVQQAFTINPAFPPVGTPVITVQSSGLNFFTPGLIQFNNSPTLSAFQANVNSAGVCANQGPILHNGDSVLVAHWRIAYPVGFNFNCVPHNLSMIRPTEVVPGGNVNLRFAVTKWTTTNCSFSTSVTISNQGLYTSQAGGTLLTQMNNMAPKITNPVNVTIDECTPQVVTFSITYTSTGVASAPITFQWFENGIPLSNIIPYSGVTTSQLTITYPSIAMNQNAYSVIVNQCNTQTSVPAILTVIECPLPIELLSFSAIMNPQNNFVDISWSTATEIINDFFTIERSSDAINFETLNNIKGAGNSTIVHEYYLVDEKPLPDISYYRLKQTDFDKNYKFSDPVSVRNYGKINFIVYPNPSDGNKIQLSISGNQKEELLILIYDMNGHLIFSKNTFISSKENTLILSPQNKLPPGIYVVEVKNESEIKHLSLVVN